MDNGRIRVGLRLERVLWIACPLLTFVVMYAHMTAIENIHYKSDIPTQFLSSEPQALTHAHNLFLNTWLESGLIGVVLEMSLLIALVVRFCRLRHATPWICAAGVALVVGMLAKNSTDDFMWRTTALAFGSFAGLLLGRGERLFAPRHEDVESSSGA